MVFKADDPVDGPVGLDLWDRADRVLPGGAIYLSRSADMAGRGVLPGFIAEANGCRVIDADGRSYIDLLGANGPNLLGYRHPEVEAAVDAQRRRMTSASMFPPALVEVVEALLSRFEGMTWGVMSKNGSEVVSLGARVARQHTGRERLIAFERAYHGNDPELAARPPTGPLAGVTRAVDRLPWNEPQMLVDHTTEHGVDVAAILLNPLDQNPRLPTRSPTPDFIAAIELVRERHGILVVFDDVRHGFRLHPAGSHRMVGIDPDMIVLGKALGNGHAISALLGTALVRPATRKIFYTSTYMFEATAMHAAMSVLDIYDRDDAHALMTAMGERLRSGLLDAADRQGHRINYTGPVTMPTLLFDDDPDGERMRRFAVEAARRGAILHPVLNWNLSAAHLAEDIDETIEVADSAFAAVP